MHVPVLLPRMLEQSQLSAEKKILRKNKYSPLCFIFCIVFRTVEEGVCKKSGMNLPKKKRRFGDRRIPKTRLASTRHGATRPLEIVEERQCTQPPFTRHWVWVWTEKNLTSRNNQPRRALILPPLSLRMSSFLGNRGERFLPRPRSRRDWPRNRTNFGQYAFQ